MLFFCLVQCCGLFALTEMQINDAFSFLVDQNDVLSKRAVAEYGAWIDGCLTSDAMVSRDESLAGVEAELAALQPKVSKSAETKRVLHQIHQDPRFKPGSDRKRKIQVLLSAVEEKERAFIAKRRMLEEKRKSLSQVVGPRLVRTPGAPRVRVIPEDAGLGGVSRSPERRVVAPHPRPKTPAKMVPHLRPVPVITTGDLGMGVGSTPRPRTSPRPDSPKDVSSLPPLPSGRVPLPRGLSSPRLGAPAEILRTDQEEQDELVARMLAMAPPTPRIDPAIEADRKLAEELGLRPPTPRGRPVAVPEKKKLSPLVRPSSAAPKKTGFAPVRTPVKSRGVVEKKTSVAARQGARVLRPGEEYVAAGRGLADRVAEAKPAEFTIHGKRVPAQTGLDCGYHSFCNGQSVVTLFKDGPVGGDVVACIMRGAVPTYPAIQELKNAWVAKRRAEGRAVDSRRALNDAELNDFALFVNGKVPADIARLFKNNNLPSLYWAWIDYAQDPMFCRNQIAEMGTMLGALRRMPLEDAVASLDLDTRRALSSYRSLALEFLNAATCDNIYLNAIRAFRQGKVVVLSFLDHGGSFGVGHWTCKCFIPVPDGSRVEIVNMDSASGGQYISADTKRFVNDLLHLDLPTREDADFIHALLLRW